MCDVVQKLPLAAQMLYCRECGREFPLGLPYVDDVCEKGQEPKE